MPRVRKTSKRNIIKIVIKWILISGLIYLLVIWFIAQSDYRCDRIDYLTYLKLMCEK